MIESEDDHVKNTKVFDNLTGNALIDTEASNEVALQNDCEGGEEVYEPMDEDLVADSSYIEEIRDNESIHSNVEMNTNATVILPTGGQPSCSEDSQDAATTSDMYDVYTDDSNSITWENFHHTVLKLKANNNKDKTPVTFTSLKDNDPSSCDIENGKPASADLGAENETAQLKEDAAHEQSFEGIIAWFCSSCIYVI